MRFRASLVWRVVTYLILAQFAAFLATVAINYGIGLAKVGSFDISLDSLATERATSLVIESLRRDETGRVRIDPSERLRAELERSPDFKFAAFDSRLEPLAGSSPELVGLLAVAIKVNSSHTHFNLPGEAPWTPKGYAALRATPFGELEIAVYGDKFRSEDIIYTIADELRWSAVGIASAIVVTVASAWFAVRQGLAPLRQASLDAAHIDLNSLDQRLASDRLPVEIEPLVSAMNSALSRLDASARRLRRYTANAAHELRTPLALMRARLDEPDEPALRADLLQDANHLQAIVEQILIAARLTEKQVPLDQEVDLVKAIRPVVSRYLPLALKCDRALEFEATTMPAITSGNQKAIECAVANLIDNALRAEPEGGTVIVCVDERGVVKVIDHGEGVDPAHHDLIFEPFWRKSDGASGAGLGLSITKELMEKHGGRIWVEPTTGGGATFALAFSSIEEGS